MLFPGTDFWQLNLDRVEQHCGATFTCEECNGTGIVEDDLVSATTVSMNRYVWSWWIHESCAQKREA